MLDAERRGDIRTFYAQIATRRRVIAWPLGRLDVADSTLTARAWPSWYMRRRSASKASVVTINVRQNVGGMVLTVDDACDEFADLRISVQVRSYYKLRAELDKHGYLVVGEEPRRTLRALLHRRDRV